MREAVALVSRLALFQFITAYGEALDLSVDLDVQVQLGSRAACAVVQCVEERPPGLVPILDQEQSSRNISSLTIFKHIRSTPCEKNPGHVGLEVASVTSQRPRIEQVANGVKVEGLLDDSGAVLKLELFKSLDCQADFACSFRTMGENGEESEKVARVQQGRRPGQEDGERAMSSVSLQILDLMYQLDTKMTMTSRAAEKLETKLESIDKNVNNKLDLLSQSSENLKRDVKMLENKLEALKDRLEDKFESSQNRIEDKLEGGIEEKLGQVHMQITTFTQSTDSYVENMRMSLNQSVSGLSRQIQREQMETWTNLNSAAENLLDNQSNATERLLSTARDLALAQTALQKDLHEKLVKAVGEISEGGVNVSRTVADDFVLLEQNLQDSVRQIASSINASATDLLRSARDLVLQSNSTTGAALVSLLAPKRCTRGLVNILPHSPYPYPRIEPSEDGILDVAYLCDTATDSGGWIIIQRRSTGHVDFYRGWEDYKNGFGELSGDFYLGNDNIHRITNNGLYELRVELDFQGQSYYARYGHFEIASEAHNYSLVVGYYSGNAGDAMSYHNGKQFTTKDRDNDKNTSRNCAVFHSGAWWYSNCVHTNLNGKWQGLSWRGPNWSQLSGDLPVSYTEMKLRRRFN